MRTSLKNMLTSSGFTEVFEAGNGQEAVNQYKLHQPDLVLMDITMPVMDGISAVKAIKELDGDAKIIMCSAMGQKNLGMEAIEAGATDFIIKPFNKGSLLEGIEKVIGEAA